MFAIQPWSLDRGDEELGAVGVFAGIGHAEPTRTIMLQLEVLIRETVSIDAFTYIKRSFNNP